MQVFKEFYLYYFMKIDVYWRISILIVLVVSGLIMYVLYKKTMITRNQAISAALITIWIWFVVVSTFLSRERLYDTYQYNLNLFWQIREIALSNTLYDKLVYIRYVLYNFLMLLPVGCLMPIITKRGKLIISFLTGFFISAIIEMMQLLFMRGLFELDDIIYNTLGVLVGYLLYRLCEVLFKQAKSIRTKKQMKDKG